MEKPITTIPERPFRGRMGRVETFAPEIRYDVYLSGPITSHGDMEENLRAFAHAAKTLRAQGLRVFSPPENEPPDLTWSDYLRRDLVELMSAATLVTLPGYERSRGALLESDVAWELGIPVLSFDDALAACGIAGCAAPFLPPDPEGDPDDIIEATVGNLAEEPLVSGAPLYDSVEIFEAEFGKIMCDPPTPNPRTAREYLASPEYKEGHEAIMRHFETGSVRDVSTGKGRFDLLPMRALREVAKHFQRGADHYGDRNWELGQPIARSFLDSGMRHLCSTLAGETNEDHLVAAAWNILCAIDTRERIKEGLLPGELNDLP